MELQPIGYFSKTHGVKGQLVLKTEKDVDEQGLKALFVESSSGKAPYFVSELKEAGGSLIVSLEEIQTVEKARLLIGKTVFADASLVSEVETDDVWIGFEVLDKQHGSLGLVSAVSDNGSQVLLSLRYKEKEVILPLVEEFIEQVDEESKKIYFNAPEGLIDLYLEGE